MELAYKLRGKSPADSEGVVPKQFQFTASSKLLSHRRQCLIRRAQQGSRFVQYHGHRNVAQHIFEMPLVLERSEESSILNFLDDFYGDAARHVNPAQREHLQR